MELQEVGRVAGFATKEAEIAVAGENFYAQSRYRDDNALEIDYQCGAIPKPEASFREFGAAVQVLGGRPASVKHRQPRD
jgi:hypothetical protein